jgi:hypothetical protein
MQDDIKNSWLSEDDDFTGDEFDWEDDTEEEDEEEEEEEED